MMLRFALGEELLADKIDDAIEHVLKEGYRTKDISSFGASEVCSTTEIGSIIADYVSK
jgi:3-isopropylmalate dehydrogenase